LIAPLIIPPRGARRLRRCLPPVARYTILGIGATALICITLYLFLEGQAKPALISALCLVPIAITVVAQALGWNRQRDDGPGA
jgi:hypothetical protein